MIELAQHIETLLLENDCVIVPGFGGFVAHYSPATRVKEENIFLPPTRTIGFNPQLKLNDGVLVQSYMSAYDTSFADASRIVEKEVNEFIGLLHEEGKAHLDNIGEIHYNIYGNYEFVPYDYKITTPSLYGLDSFEMHELSVLQQKEKVWIPAHPEKEKKTFEISINRAYLRNAAAMIAAIVLFFAFSTPVENTDVQKNNYAQLLPSELFEQIEKQSVVVTPNLSRNFADMIELAQHIETLLLENDCVIVPGFGGFVAHYSPATRVKEENIFLPPTRTIGFNPQLKLNDGVLVQSYMSAYDTSFADASRIVEKEVNEFIGLLHEEGKAHLDNIGEIHYNIYGNYEFVPYDYKITTPSLYGLDSFEMHELSVLQQKEKVWIPAHPEKEKKTFEISINRAYLRNAAAMIAAIVLFFAFSTPVENTDVQKNNYAQLLPSELFEQIEKQSVVVTPVYVKSDAMQQAKKLSATASTSLATQLKSKGFANAKALNMDGKVRVSISSFDNRNEATKQLLELRKNETYKNAWLLAK